MTTMKHPLVDWHWAHSSRPWLPVVLGWVLALSLILGTVTVAAAPGDDPRPTPSPTRTSSPALGLPGRHTATPDQTAVPAAASASPPATSPFMLPTAYPQPSPTPAIDCTAVFPLDNVTAIEFGVTTLIQLEASFGRAAYQGGRSPRYRFEEQGCVMIVTVGFDEVFEAELQHYGTLDLLLERFGEPAAVGISQGNLTLLDIGRSVLFYPEAGVIAVFDVAPDDLTLETVITSLYFRAPLALDRQAARLNVRFVIWEAPGGAATD